MALDDACIDPDIAAHGVLGERVAVWTNSDPRAPIVVEVFDGPDCMTNAHLPLAEARKLRDRLDAVIRQKECV